MSSLIDNLTSDQKNRYVCFICLQLMQNPAFLPCGHEACKECFEKTFQVKKQCPICRGTETTITINCPKKLEINGLTFNCSSCGEKKAYKDHKLHELTCSVNRIENKEIIESLNVFVHTGLMFAGNLHNMFEQFNPIITDILKKYCDNSDKKIEFTKEIFDTFEFVLGNITINNKKIRLFMMFEQGMVQFQLRESKNILFSIEVDNNYKFKIKDFSNASMSNLFN